MKKANFAAVFGNGIVAQANDTFHVSCLNACNTPALSTSPVSGTIAYITCGDPIPFGARALYIVP